jgi:hypothetical protein
MQGIHTYIPETNHVTREHRVATILVLLFMVLISLVPALAPLYLYVSTFRSMCAVSNIAVDMDMSYARVVHTASLTSYPVRCKILHQRTASLS